MVVAIKTLTQLSIIKSKKKITKKIITNIIVEYERLLISIRDIIANTIFNIGIYSIEQIVFGYKFSDL